MATNSPANTAFDWSIYSDATFAGLSELIPVPLADWASEEFFRRRMPAAIAQHRGRNLPAAVVGELNQGERGILTACLMFPVKFVFKLIIGISRKLLYFLSVKAAAEKVSYYWHRAFLIDYMLAQGHLQQVEAAQIAQQAQAQVLQNTHSPLTQLARQAINDMQHAWRMVRRARQGEEDAEVRQTRSYLEQRWAEVEDYLVKLAADYDQTYRQLRERQGTTPA